MLGRVVRALAASPVDDVAVGVALGANNARKTVLGHTHEVVGAGRSTDGINGDLHGARGAVLEADGTRQTCIRVRVNWSILRAWMFLILYKF